MNEREAVIRALLSKTIAYKKVYSDIMGDVQGGVWLSQVVYWSQRSEGYFYKSKTEWEEETGLTERQVRRIEKIAQKLGIIDIKLAMAEGRETNHYLLNVDGLIEQFIKLPPTKGKGSPNRTSVVSLTENTENIEEYFNSRPEHLKSKGKVKTRTTGERNKATAKAIEAGANLSSTIKADFRKWLGLTPNWDTKTNQANYQFFRERYSLGETAQQFKEWWVAEDWRGKQGQQPSYNNVREMWLQAFTFTVKKEQPVKRY